MAPDSEDTRVDRGPAPRRIGRFETVRLLGRGGMGSVYLAEDRVIGRQVAVKEIRVEQGVSATAVAEQRVRFEVELRAAGRLSHPNIATVYDAFETEGAYYIALEYVPGTSLDERLKAGPPLIASEVADLAAQIAAGLDYAHRRGIVHRDIKPGNILLSEEGAVKITDFGIAKLVSLDVTQTGIALGTPAYMSPEQIRGETLDGRSDQFSLGVMLYQMLVGRLPFEGATAHSLLYKVIQTDPVRPAAINAALPPAVDGVVMRALAKDPADRYPTCAELARDLASALKGTAAAAPPAAAPAPPTVAPAPFESAPRPARSVLPWALGCFALLALLVGGVFVYYTSLDWEPRAPGTRPQTSPSPAITPAPPAATPQPIPEETAPPAEETAEPSPAEPQIAEAERVAVEITSEPGRCRVSIDGRHAGFTPLTETLKPGRHQFTCDWPGQGSRSVEETVSASRRRLRFQL
jgi:tRNA A-37 threonylcarbamoyl transferase component Bud32